jgi:hypothetical protein
MIRFAALALMVIVAGCSAAPETPRAELLAAELAFTDIVNELATLKALGELGEADVADLAPAVRADSAALDAAHTTFTAGGSIVPALATARAARNAAIARLLAPRPPD